MKQDGDVTFNFCCIIISSSQVAGTGILQCLIIIAGFDPQSLFEL